MGPNVSQQSLASASVPLWNPSAFNRALVKPSCPNPRLHIEFELLLSPPGNHQLSNLPLAFRGSYGLPGPGRLPGELPLGQLEILILTGFLSYIARSATNRLIQETASKHTSEPQPAIISGPYASHPSPRESVAPGVCAILPRIPAALYGKQLSSQSHWGQSYLTPGIQAGPHPLTHFILCGG